MRLRSSTRSTTTATAAATRSPNRTPPLHVGATFSDIIVAAAASVVSPAGCGDAPESPRRGSARASGDAADRDGMGARRRAAPGGAGPRRSSTKFTGDRDRRRRCGRVKAGPARLAFPLFCSGFPPWRWATLVDMLDRRRGQTAPSAGALGVPGRFAPFLDIGAPPNGGVAEQRLVDRAGSYGSRLVSRGDQDAGRVLAPLTCTGWDLRPDGDLLGDAWG